MKFRILSALSVSAMLSLPALAQLPRIVVEGAGAPQVFAQFADAVAAAQPNDKIYISGGTFTYTSNLQITKPLHVIGAGIHPDSTQVTGVTTLQQTGGNTAQPLRIMDAASGSTFTGIRFVSLDAQQGSYALYFGTTNANDDVADVVFQRCWFQGRVYLGLSGGTLIPTTTAFDECVFMGPLDAEGRSAVFTRCIISNGVNTITLTGLAGSSAVENCVVLGTIQSCNGVSIRNSFLRSNGGYASFSCANCTFQNNLTPSATVTNTSPGAVLINNLVNVDPSTVFVSETDGFYQITDNLHMAPGSPGIGFATDGNDIGIHGTAAPYKPGAVPFNPHFRQATIAGGTNTNGELPVNIRVAAQPN
ncbi:MAG: hypothetical protein IPM46_01380 [Flavobacteriales bacterium]|nr:hypothetical protein [Flavobacteriales bacterium]